MAASRESSRWTSSSVSIFTVSLLLSVLISGFCACSGPTLLGIMADLFRESTVGQIVRFITKGRFLKYSEEKDGFLCPNYYTQHPPATSHSGEIVDVAEKVEFPTSPGSLSSPATLADSDPMDEAGKTRAIDSLDAETLRRVTSRVEMGKVTTRRDLERAYTAATQRESLKRGASYPIVPQRTADGIVIVTWYDTDDQDNPQNWSFRKKAIVATQILYAIETLP
jgi:DHA1 family multidrug resistance protein-like MFS transporter